MLSQTVRGFTLIAALAAILFLPAAVCAQDKDAEIARLKEDIVALEAKAQRLAEELAALDLQR
jgi:hypothetical protein